jgi:hypothetical protein
VSLKGANGELKGSLKVAPEWYLASQAGKTPQGLQGKRPEWNSASQADRTPRGLQFKCLRARLNLSLF